MRVPAHQHIMLGTIQHPKHMLVTSYTFQQISCQNNEEIEMSFNHHVCCRLGSDKIFLYVFHLNPLMSVDKISVHPVFVPTAKDQVVSARIS